MDVRLAHGKLSDQELVKALDAWLPGALEALVLPRFRELLCEVLDARRLTEPEAPDMEATRMSEAATRMSTDALTRVSSADCVSTVSPVSPGAAVVAQREMSCRETSCRSTTMVFEEPDGDSSCVGGTRVLHPNSPWRWLWDSAALVVFVVDIIYTTFELAFLAGSGSYYAADVLTGLFWSCDIAVNFVTGYLDSSTCLVEMRQKQVAKHYLCTWFPVDFLATAQPPLAFLVQSTSTESGASTNLLALFKVLKLTKLLRVAKLNVLRRRLARLETRTQSKAIICALCMFQLLAVLMFASHLFACLLWSAGQQALREQRLELSWLGSRQNLDLVGASLLRQYMATMHLSISIMTGMGTGPVSTALFGEELLLSCFYLASLSLVGVIVNEVAAMYSKMSESSLEVTQAITGASSFMNWYKVPPSLQLRVERYLQNIFDHKEHTDYREQLNQWLQASGGLLAELNFSIFGSYLTSHPQLRLLPRETVSFVANLCSSTFFPPGEVVMQATWKPVRMLWLRSGSLEVVSALPGKKLARQVYRPNTKPQGAAAAGALSAAGSSQSLQREGYIKEERVVLGEGDMLFHRQLLLPGTERSGCTASCASFCEVMALEYKRFQEELNRRSPKQLQEARIHAAVQEDAVDALAVALGGRCRQKTVFGDSLLHLCIRQSAEECLRWLLSQGSRPDVKDRSGRTPLEVAKALKQKSLVDTLVLSGLRLQGPLELPKQQQQRRFRSLAPELSLAAKTTQDLAQQLQSAGLEPASLGRDGGKGLAELLQELQEGYGSLVYLDKTVKRVLHVARVRVLARVEGQVRVLSETEDARWFSEGAVQLPMKKMRGASKQALEEALEALFSKYLGLSSKFLQRHFDRGLELLFEEEKETHSFPGLQCIYRVHEVPFWVRDSALELCASLGLPQGHVFRVQEERDRGLPRLHVFTWLDSRRPSPEARAAELGQQLRRCGHCLGAAALAALAKEEDMGVSSIVEDVDGGLVRVLCSVRLRISGGFKVLHQLGSNGAARPSAPVVGGHLERAVGELWQRLLRREGILKRNEDSTLKLVAQHFTRGITSRSEEPAEGFHGLPCVLQRYEVQFTLANFRARTSCISLGLPCMDEAEPRQGLLWLPDSEETDLGPRGYH